MPAREESPVSEKKEIYLLPYAHLDTQWRWEYPTTIKKYIPKTMDRNFELLKKYPGYCFNFTGMIRYAMMKEYYPDKYEVVKDYVELGRWFPAGTCLDETDALVPSMESMVRNILYGHRQAVREFGRSSSDYLLPDCFGFPGNMPTVLAHMGIKGFSTQKLSWHSAVGIPFQLGFWKGPEGSEILSTLNPGAYTSHLRLPVHMSPGAKKMLKEQGEKTGVWKSFQYYGVGDMGGAPKEGSVKKALQAVEKGSEGELTVRQGSPDDFYGSVTPEERSRLERYEGDFLLTLHSAGTLTSAAVMKRWNRKNEQLAFAAEAAAAAAYYTKGAPWPAEKIQAAWTRIIGSQMHDILPGTSTPNAYRYAWNDEVVALNLWNSVLEDSARSIAPSLAGDGPLLLYNPVPQEREDMVEVQLPEDLTLPEGSVVIVSSEGERYSGQITPDHGKNGLVLRFHPQLGCLSWQRFSVEAVPVPAEPEVSLVRGERGWILENSRLRASVSAEGVLYSIYSKTHDRELLKKPLAYEFQKEVPGMFPAWNMNWSDRKQPPFARLEKGEVEVLEEGPLSCALAVTFRYGDSKMVREIRLNGEADLLDFTERIRWREKACSLKLSITGNLKKGQFTTNWESSRVRRGVNSEKVYEMPSRYWADLSDSEGWGFSLLEDCKYGYDHPSEDTLRMTLLFTPGIKALDAFRDQGSLDWGEHTIGYAIRPHSDGWESSDRFGRLFNQPVRPFILKDRGCGTGVGAVEPELSLFSFPGDDLFVSAVKKAEEGDGLVLRLYERKGRESSGHFKFSRKIAKVCRINGLEEILEELPHKEDSFDVTLKADSLASLLVEFADPVRVELPRQENLSLPYNCTLISPNTAAGEGIIPAEQIPVDLYSGADKYRLFPKAKKNALRCNSQALRIPSGTNTLLLLCTARVERESAFIWRDDAGKILNSEDVVIPVYKGFAGQWDRRIWKKEPEHEEKQKSSYIWKNSCTGIEKGYVKRDRIEFFTTHTHRNGEDQAYKFGYLYTLRLSVPEGAVTLQLPSESSLYIAAVTASREHTEVRSAVYLKDRFDY